MKIKLVKNEMNQILRELPDSKLIPNFKAVAEITTMVYELHSSMKTVKEILEEDGDTTLYEDRQAIALEQLDSYADFYRIQTFSKSAPFENEYVNTHLRNSTLTLENYMGTVSDLVLAGGIMDDEVIIKTRDTVGYILSEFLYVLAHGYGLFAVSREYNKNLEEQVDNAVVEIQSQVALGIGELRFDSDIFEYAQWVAANSLKYPTKLEVFEEYPELEQQFYETLGAYVDAFLAEERFINLQTVNAVLECQDPTFDAVLADFLKYVAEEKKNIQKVEK